MSIKLHSAYIYGLHTTDGRPAMTDGTIFTGGLFNMSHMDSHFELNNYIEFTASNYDRLYTLWAYVVENSNPQTEMTYDPSQIIYCRLDKAKRAVIYDRFMELNNSLCTGSNNDISNFMFIPIKNSSITNINRLKIILIVNTYSHFFIHLYKKIYDSQNNKYILERKQELSGTEASSPNWQTISLTASDDIDYIMLGIGPNCIYDIVQIEFYNEV